MKGESLELVVYEDTSFNNVGDCNQQIGFIMILKARKTRKYPLSWKSQSKNSDKVYTGYKCIGPGRGNGICNLFKAILRENHRR